MSVLKVGTEITLKVQVGDVTETVSARVLSLQRQASGLLHITATALSGEACCYALEIDDSKSEVPVEPGP